MFVFRAVNCTGELALSNMKKRENEKRLIELYQFIYKYNNRNK